MVNTTFFNTTNNILDIYTGINSNISGFPYLILGALAIILFLGNLNESAKKIMIIEGYIMAVVSAIFIGLQWLDISVIYIPLFCLSVGIFATIFIKKDY